MNLFKRIFKSKPVIKSIEADRLDAGHVLYDPATETRVNVVSVDLNRMFFVDNRIDVYTDRGLIEMSRNSRPFIIVN